MIELILDCAWTWPTVAQLSVAALHAVQAGFGAEGDSGEGGATVLNPSTPDHLQKLRVGTVALHWFNKQDRCLRTIANGTLE